MAVFEKRFQDPLDLHMIPVAGRPAAAAFLACLLRLFLTKTLAARLFNYFLDFLVALREFGIRLRRAALLDGVRLIRTHFRHGKSRG